MRYDLNMLDRVTETPVMQAAATFTKDYDSPYDSTIPDDSSSHAHATATDADTSDSSASNSEEEPAFSHHTSDNDSQGRPAERRYQMLDETHTLHPWLDWDSAEDMIAQVQPHWSYNIDIDESEIEDNDSDYNNIEPSREVEPDPIVTNALSTLGMYNPVAEFPELFSGEKPTELPPLREHLEIIQHRNDVMPNSEWKPRFPSTYNQFKDQITKKIITELETGRIVQSKSSNSIGMFRQPKKDKPLEARFLLYCIARNLVTHEDKTLMPSMEHIKDFIAYRPFRSKLDLTDGYYNIRIHLDSVRYSTFTWHMGKLDSLVMLQGDCNAPATMTGAMNYLYGEVQDPMIYSDDILIVNHSYEEHINTIRHVFQIGKENKLWFNRHKCQFMPDELAVLVDFVRELALEADPDKVNFIQQFAKPDNGRQLLRFLDMVNYLRQFGPKPATAAAFISELQESTKQWKGTDLHTCSFQTCKDRIMSNKVLKPINPDTD